MLAITFLLYEAEYDIVVYDNWSNASCKPLNSASAFIGQAKEFIEHEVSNCEMLTQALISWVKTLLIASI